MRHPDPERVALFSDFGRRMLASDDIDPAFRVMREHGFDLGDQGLEWLSCLYLAYYNLPSALQAFDRYPEPTAALLRDADILRLPTGTERRNIQMPDKLRLHLAYWVDEARSHDGWAMGVLDRDWTADARDNHRHVYERLLHVPYNGRWAAYKGAEVLQKVCGWPLRASDAGHDQSIAPRKGLSLLFDDQPEGNGQQTIRLLDARTAWLQEAMLGHGVEVQVEQVETLLCDFHAMSNGRYYVGHDIDLMLEQANAQLDDRLWNQVMRARYDALNHAYLGEMHGWDSRDKALMKHYVRTGTIGDRADAEVTA